MYLSLKEGNVAQICFTSPHYESTAPYIHLAYIWGIAFHKQPQTGFLKPCRFENSILFQRRPVSVIFWVAALPATSGGSPPLLHATFCLAGLTPLSWHVQPYTRSHPLHPPMSLPSALSSEGGLCRAAMNLCRAALVAGYMGHEGWASRVAGYVAGISRSRVCSRHLVAGYTCRSGAIILAGHMGPDRTGRKGLASRLADSAKPCHSISQ